MSGPAEIRQSVAGVDELAQALAEVRAARETLSRQLAEVSAERDALSKELIECVGEREAALRHRGYVSILMDYVIRAGHTLYRIVPTPRFARPIIRKVRSLVGGGTKPRRRDGRAEPAAPVSDHGMSAQQLEEVLATIALRGRPQA